MYRYSEHTEMLQFAVGIAANSGGQVGRGGVGVV